MEENERKSGDSNEGKNNRILMGNRDLGSHGHKYKILLVCKTILQHSVVGCINDYFPLRKFFFFFFNTTIKDILSHMYKNK